MPQLSTILFTFEIGKYGWEGRGEKFLSFENNTFISCYMLQRLNNIIQSIARIHILFLLSYNRLINIVFAIVRMHITFSLKTTTWQ